MTDNSVQVDPNAVILVRSSNQSGQELPIGTNAVKVTATDEAGNMDSCSFSIVVRGNYYTYVNLVYNTWLIQWHISEQNLLFFLYMLRFRLARKIDR